METIKRLITDGKTDEAIRLLDEYIEKNASSDEAYYLRGNAYRKKSAIIMSHAFRHEAFQGINHGTCGNHGT